MTDFLTEECFCLKYELEALAEITLRNQSERWIPGFIQEITEDSHLKRYQLATQYSKDKVVLDIACGVGKGSNILATLGEANLVVGCDIQEDAIRYAKHRNKHDKVIFEVQNAEQYFKDEFYDLVVSYETVEHLKNYRQFLSNLQKSLKRNGTLIMSTPISRVPFDEKPANQYHCQEWGFLEFQRLLSKYFSIDTVFVQLYQNVFLNEHLAPGRELSTIFKKVIKKFLRFKNPQKNGEFNKWNVMANYSKISEYKEQFALDKLGSQYIGYQILVCKKQ